MLHVLQYIIRKGCSKNVLYLNKKIQLNQTSAYYTPWNDRNFILNNRAILSPDKLKTNFAKYIILIPVKQARTNNNVMFVSGTPSFYPNHPAIIINGNNKFYRRGAHMRLIQWCLIISRFSISISMKKLIFIMSRTIQPVFTKENIYQPISFLDWKSLLSIDD